MSALYAMPGNEAMADLLVRHSGIPRRALDLHRFPDGETLVRIEPPPQGDVAIVCTLDRPDPKLLPLLMAAATARELGAARVGLVAPYLAYMRQDTRFHPGEAVSAGIFGKLLGGAFDWLVTVDPHLHRYRQLDEACPLDARVVHAAPRAAAWIRDHVESPLIVGPDGESAQWANAVAAALGAPCVTASKERRGDREVRIELPGVERWPAHRPVLLDDIIASGQTMIETLHCLRRHGRPAAVCVGLHGVFAAGAREGLLAAGASRVVTSNSIAGSTALIDVSEDLAAAMNALRSDPRPAGNTIPGSTSA
ncbi:MAG: ribose-phosphate diphosphokinase [Xanthomonadaceae bacterium]|nr:ribose-phosphate diphosphokinase [Xanthomonadaceae bacterium]MDE3072665.1 ribose-phosphate diphosphokinase [Pseudomonadota bacterium]